MELKLKSNCVRSKAILTLNESATKIMQGQGVSGSLFGELISGDLTDWNPFFKVIQRK